MSLLQDTAAQVADSVAAADSTPADTTAGQAIQAIGEGVTSAGRLIAEGEWELLWYRALAGFYDMMASLTPRLISALFVVLVFYAIYRAILSVVHRVLRRSARVERGMEAVIVRSLRLLMLAFVAVMGLSQLGINVSALVAGLGIAGLAVGFAAKDSLENFISGVTILLDRPFRVGDWVEVDERYGKVTELTLRSTRIRTLNREEVVFPNVKMVSNAVTNHSAGPTLRVDVPFGVAYKEDIDETREVVEGLAADDERVAHTPAPRMVVTGLGSSSVDMELHLHVLDPGEKIPVLFDYTERVRKALARAGIEIPFPHMQLFLDEAKGLEKLEALRSRREAADAEEAEGEGPDPHGHEGEHAEDEKDPHHGDEAAEDEAAGDEPDEAEPADDEDDEDDEANDPEGRGSD